MNTFGQSIVTGLTETTITTMEDLFDVGDYVYIDNFYLQSGTTIKDFSNVYHLTGHTSAATWAGSDITISLFSSSISQIASGCKS